MAAMQKEAYDSDEELAPVMTGGASEEAATAEPEEDTSINNSDVMSKYQESAKICNDVIQAISALCIPGATVISICRAGDDLINSICSGIYRNKVKGRTIEKGIAFPVCISVNECICHMSPLASEEPVVLNAADIVKIDMGVHIDGYITLAAHTVIVAHSPTAEPITGALADVVAAAWTCAEVAARLITPGNNNTEVTAAMKRVCEHFGVNPLSGSVMHQVKRYVIDGSKNIAMHDATADTGKVEKCSFEAGEIWALDIMLSTGDGKRKERNTRTTVFKRVVDAKYGLKIASSRKFLNEVNAKYPSLPFSLRMFEDEMGAKMGVRECVTHELITPYSVLYEAPEAQLCHVKYTVLLTNSGNVKITGLNMPANVISARVDTLPDDLKELIATVSIEKKKKNKGSKGKKVSPAP